MHKNRLVPILTLVCLAMPFSAFGETILLKSGQKIEGKVLEIKGDYVKIDFKDIVITYLLDEIDTIDGKKAAAGGQDNDYGAGAFFKEAYLEDSFKKGSALLKDGKYDQAIKEFNLVVSAAPKHSAANHNLGCAYFAKKDYDLAIEKFNLAFAGQQEPYSGITEFNIAMCYQVKALEAKLGKDSPEYKENLGLAEKYYKKSIEILPNFPQSHSNLALIYFYEDKPKSFSEEEADLAAKQADALGAFVPDILGKIYSFYSYEAQLSIVENYLAAGRLAKAEEELNALIRVIDKNPPQKSLAYWSTYNILGYCLFQRRDLNGALDCYSKSLRIEPNQPRADVTHGNLGIIYLEKGDSIAAKREFEKALELNPQNQTAKEFLDKTKARPF